MSAQSADDANATTTATGHPTEGPDNRKSTPRMPEGRVKNARTSQSSAHHQLLVLRGKRRCAQKVFLPRVRQREDPELLATVSDTHVPKIRDRRIASPQPSFELNISLLGGDMQDSDNSDDNMDESSGDVTGVGESSSERKRTQARTIKLVVPWDPSTASANHLVYEAYKAFAFLHSKFICTRTVPTPVILLNQIYSVIDDRTLADREVHELARKGVVRILRCPAQYPQDTCIMLETDFVSCVTDTLSAAYERGQPAFGSTAITSSHVHIKQRRLTKCFKRSIRAHRGQHVCSLADLRARLRRKGAAPHECIDVLTDAKLLFAPPSPVDDVPLAAEQNAATDNAAFRVPYLLQFLGEARASRKEILRFVASRRHAEVPWTECASLNLKATEMCTDLFIRDLVGSGRLKIAAQTSAGRILRRL